MKIVVRALALVAPLALAACGGLETGGPRPIETGTRIHEDPAAIPDGPSIPELPDPTSPAQAFLKLLLPQHRSRGLLVDRGVSPLGSSPEPVPGYDNGNGGGSGGSGGEGDGRPQFKP